LGQTRELCSSAGAKKGKNGKKLWTLSSVIEEKDGRGSRWIEQKRWHSKATTEEGGTREKKTKTRSA